MEDNEHLLHIAEAVSDTSSAEIDWEKAEADATNDEERELVKLLRDIRAVADLRRTRTKDPGAPVAFDAPPSSWGNFDIVDKLGEGAAAEVFRVRDVTLNREVALKLFREVGELDSRRREILLREGRHLTLVHHPNVVTVHGADEHDGRVGIWMGLVSGRTLAEIVETQGRFSASEASQIGIDLCGAIASVHRSEIRHGDIKAQNVKRETGGRIVLMDFGSSRGAAPSSADADTTGTPLYMAPELLNMQETKPTVPGDIYALGVLLYYLVTGKFPVRARTVAELERAHERGERHRLRDERPELPDAFVRTVEKALSRDPRARFQSMGEFEEALREPARMIDGPPSPKDLPVPQEVKWLAVVARIGLVVGIVVTVLAGLGFITSTALNVALGRSSEFAPETLMQLSVWGLRSIVGPIYHLVTTVVPFLAMYLLIQLVWRLSWVRKRCSAPVATASALVAKLRLHDPRRLAHIIAVSGGLALAALTWWYYGLIEAIYLLSAPPIDPATISMLSPENELYHLAYRRHFTLLVTALLVSTFAVRRYSKRKRMGSSFAWIGGVIILATVLLEFPWQILWQAEFPRVMAGDERCYDIGTKGEETLLFCPLSRQKNRLVPATDGNYERDGVVESVFTLEEAASNF